MGRELHELQAPPFLSPYGKYDVYLATLDDPHVRFQNLLKIVENHFDSHGLLHIPRGV
jgi:hypothetical protein